MMGQYFAKHVSDDIVFPLSFFGAFFISSFFVLKLTDRKLFRLTG
jgi:hypothetical protein